MTNNDTFDPDKLVSDACSQSIVIQDLIEQNKPEALDEFIKFQEQAINALNLQLESVSTLDVASSNYFDEFLFLL